MITNTQASAVNTATTESRDFTIKADGKAFRILINGLYENKIQSIVREIWANALDSHVAAGTPERLFDVTFPSIFDPVFSVRDYGTSLCHEDVMGLYSTVFESTKEDTNDAVGKFGLGSKSPFAYTDTFSVTAYMDGEKRYYSALIAENGVPQIHFMGTEETTEVNGIEVSFPIATKDIRAFRSAANRVSHGFEFKPNVVTKEDDEPFSGWPTLEILSEGDGWKLLSGAVEGYNTRAYARMGCVLYPINVEALSDLSSEEKRLLSQSTMIIDFAMGDLEISASRESLSYGPKDPTADSIKNRIRTIIAEMVSSFTDQYAEADTYWDACILFREHCGSGGIPQAVKNVLEKNAVYKGQALKKVISVGVRSTADVVVGAGFSMTSMTTKLSNQMYRFDYYCDLVSISPGHSTVVFIENMEGKVKPKRAAAKIKIAQVAAKYTQVIWIKYEGGKEGAASMVRFLEMFDGMEIIDIDDLPEITRLTGGDGIRRPVQVRKHYRGGFDERVDITPEQFEDGGYYVPLERMTPVKPSQCSGPECVWDALQRNGTVDSTAPLYGAPKSLWKLFKGDQWINIYELAAETFKASNHKRKAVGTAHMISKVISDTTLCHISSKIITAELHKDSKALAAIAYRAKVAQMNKPAVEGIILLASALGMDQVIEEWSNKEAPELNQHLAAIEEAYPLLDQFDSYYLRNEVDKLTKYVQMCDKAAAYDSLTNPTTAAVAA